MSNELPANCKFILDQHIPIDELLGSVTTYNNVDGSESKNMQIRTSARVFKKMKLDSTPVQTTPSPVVEKKEPIKEESKPEGKKPLRLWNQEDKNLFFEALNEYGKDFEAIHAHISNKLKKKGALESQMKTREQIRHLYYRTWHKISKYLIFSEEVKKVAQELYGLINYGELRKKLLFVSEKSCTKLNELIYRGFVAIRIKGKTIRIRTPMCRALRVLNQLDERHNDLKLPLKITVELKPKDIDTWMTVQKLSQNPRVKTTLPLQRRLSSLLLYMNDKWKTSEMVQYESTLKQSEQFLNGQSEDYKPPLNLLRLCPPPHYNLDVPTLNVTEYLTSQNICLNAYEERFGVKIRGEDLWLTSLSSSCKAILKKHHMRRIRHESNSEKLSLTYNKAVMTNCSVKAETEATDAEQQILLPCSVSDVVDHAVNTILALQQCQESKPEEPMDTENVDVKVEIEEIKSENAQRNEAEILKHKNGWTIDNCGTLCIGDLYLMYGAEAKVTLEYSWDQPDSKHEIIPIPVDENEDVETPIKATTTEEKVSHRGSLSHTLKRLLSMVKLHYRKNRIQCPCGHVCGGTTKNANRNRNGAKNISVVTSRDKFYNNADKPTSIDPVEGAVIQTEQTIRRLSPSVIFRRPSSPNDLLKAQLDSIQRLRPRYCNRRGRRPRTKPVIVERKLPILANRVENGRQIVQMSIISQDNVPSTPRPIAPKINVDMTGVASVESVSAGEQLNPNEHVVESHNTVTYNLIPICSTDSQINANAIMSAVIVTDNATTPSRVGSPSEISNLIQMALTSNNDTPLTDSASEELTSFVGLLPAPASSSTPPSSPSRVLKENEDQWLNSEVADFSLSSFLGHLDSPMKVAQSTASCASEDSRLCLTQAVQSLLAESSLDYTAKFADLAAQVTETQK